MADAVRETKPAELPPPPPELPRSTESPAGPDGRRQNRPEPQAQAHQEAEAASRAEYAKARADSPTAPDAQPDTDARPDAVDETAARLAELRTEGHGPQRHHDPSDQQLQDRLGTPVRDGDDNVVLRPDGFVRSTDHIDPQTGSTIESDGTTVHRCGPFATRFDSPTDYVQAEAHLRQQAIDNQDTIADGSIRDVLGEGAESRITGYYHDPARPEQYRSVDFTDGTILAVYRRDANGDLGLRTMYARPRPFLPDSD